MIICSHSNIDIIQGVIGYGDAEGITDWRISNTITNVNTAILNITNSTSANVRVSILENGNVGIGTTNPATILDIVGDANISGVYKKNNRDVINDTSNYVLSASNILVPRILTEVGDGSNYISRLNTEVNTRIDNTSNYMLSINNQLANRISNQWTNVSSGIYYNLPIITSTPSATTTGITGNYTYVVFTYTTETAGTGTGQTQYTINIPTGGLVCDILVVGGGGAGGNLGGGGGGGDVIYQTNISLPIGSYNIVVGNGGSGNTGYRLSGNNGNNSSISGTGITTITAAGGGGGGGYNQAPLTVPSIGTSSGGGGGGSTGTGTTGASSTYSGGGGNGNTSLGTPGGGGGGSVGAGVSPTIKSKAGNGGIGNDISITGTSQQYGGGGGAANWAGEFNYTSPDIGGGTGVYGGGNGRYTNFGSTVEGTSGTPNTGGGGGGGNDTTGKAGGSGIVIIRFLSSVASVGANVGIGTTNPTSKLHIYDDSITNSKLIIQNNNGGASTTSSIELIRGTSGDANIDYKIGNYNGDFKIISSTSSVDTDYIRITSSGASIYNPTGSPQWSTVSDRRIKENIEKASYDKCYNNINKLELYRFNYIAELKNINKDQKQLGYIAQEVQDIFPKAVSSQEFHNNNLSIPNMLSIDISQINYSLYGAVKKLMEIDNNTEARIKNIENLLNSSNVIDYSSNIDISSSNIDISSSNIDISSSNITDYSSNIDISSSNVIDTSSSNVDISASNVDTSSSNITDISSSNIDISSSNITDYSSNIDISSSNI